MPETDIQLTKYVFYIISVILTMSVFVFATYVFAAGFQPKLAKLYSRKEIGLIRLFFFTAVFLLSFYLSTLFINNLFQFPSPITGT